MNTIEITPTSTDTGLFSYTIQHYLRDSVCKESFINFSVTSVELDKEKESKLKCEESEATFT